MLAELRNRVVVHHCVLNRKLKAPSDLFIGETVERKLAGMCVYLFIYFLLKDLSSDMNRQVHDLHFGLMNVHKIRT